MVKYAGEADARDKQKNQAKTMQIKVLDGLASLAADNFKEAAYRLSNVSVADTEALLQLISPVDLAYYVTLTSLFSLNRKEMKETILSASNFKNLMEIAPQTQDIIENFLNGHYMEFLASLNTVSNYLRYDVFFGHRLFYIVGTIRKKALVQYVTPYKVIDMREIAKAFNLTID